MRIISGKLKGRQLSNFKAGHIRPTTDRVKETMFNKLMGSIEGARVLDLFAGTGNLGIEAYSRGAERVVSVEMNKASVKIIKENYKKLGIEGEIELICQDVLKFLRPGSSDLGSFDIILIDPPFTRKMAHDVMEVLVGSDVIETGSLIVIESSSKERIDDSYPKMSLLDRKSFGDKVVSFFEVIEVLNE